MPLTETSDVNSLTIRSVTNTERDSGLPFITALQTGCTGTINAPTLTSAVGSMEREGERFQRVFIHLFSSQFSQDAYRQSGRGNMPTAILTVFHTVSNEHGPPSEGAKAHNRKPAASTQYGAECSRALIKTEF